MSRVLESVRCSKCRMSLFSPELISKVVKKEVGKDFLALDPNFDYASHESCVWIQEALDKCGWTKGRLYCRKCDARLGGFDFVSSEDSDSPIKIVKSKVDFKTSDFADNLMDIHTSRGNLGLNEDSPSSSFSDFSLEASFYAASDDDSNESNSSKEEDEADEERIRKLEKFILETESELNQFDESLTCPICLDLLLFPHKLSPCKHMFCEACLRKLGFVNPGETYCPMCRCLIDLCEYQEELSLKIQTDYVDYQSKRAEEETLSGVYSLPLPWKPTWKGLFLGREDSSYGGRDGEEGFLSRLNNELPYLIPERILEGISDFCLLLSFVDTVQTLVLLLMLPLISVFRPGLSLFSSMSTFTFFYEKKKPSDVKTYSEEELESFIMSLDLDLKLLIRVLLFSGFTFFYFYHNTMESRLDRFIIQIRHRLRRITADYNRLLMFFACSIHGLRFLQILYAKVM